ncbi:hypothetical protein PHYBLDRAFT_169625 [Phycomyces blakesleeanus NRRL 1555(-)]|uniref:F-box domain-containing protein n=1 Tax=Phycomyces blakesleeanus (strain ATCC 8743b / DSM 1359 / FGSC 10004 / NBRC 33097 / NRRL 1555) TaxID=763407 RepID=A0A167MCY6_PHYB8|nr:hypothetical protein PHYBLDRAFT_169625 [Phycomyces blakesleeanus NRRL 1555(-)]OAD72497.1 hypothetical protein PHYBLDRAFT_169625 [Phycomyces blakesleeanus NRRL 1555(-)]|eukprot:XP_018290537.1 hypothetical protein PHYBLDRAFT_169625 [Phycomyces blakesleeanus NRRL 1555(-)]
MQASDFPFEIISKIANLLLKDDKISCILTCKAWRYPFQESLWENIEVNSMDTLEKICAIVESPTGDFIEHDLITQSLRVTGKTTLGDWNQTRFFKNFPNLKHLDIGPLTYSESQIENTEYGPQWNSVNSLKLQIDQNPGEITTGFVCKVLQKIPNLKSIDISPDIFTSSVTFGLEQYNTLHTVLPRLTHIKAQLYLNRMRRNEIPLIPLTLPALCVTSLSLDLRHWDHLWLYYFCYKYPNIQNLIWRSVYRFGNSARRAYNEARIELLRSIKKVFPYLETVDFYTEEPTEWSHSIFWNLLCLSDVPIKKIKYKIKSSDSDAAYFGMTIQRFTQSFSTTLEKISIAGNIYFDIENFVKLEFIYCPHLVSVEISDCGVSIALDNLLNNWPVLRRLKFSNVHLYIDPEAQKEETQHGLHFLVLDNIVASISVFKYMSFRCRILQYMNLSQSQIFGPISNETGSLCIDMTDTKFELLQLDHVKFYSSEEDMNNNISINLTLISHLAGHQTLAEAKEEFDENENQKSHLEYLSWYHLYCELDCPFDHVTKIRQLSEQEVCVAIKYFEAFQLKDRMDTFEVERSFNGQVDKEDWKEDLCRGYAEFRCGHIAKYNVPLFWINENSFWQNSFDSSW